MEAQEVMVAMARGSAATTVIQVVEVEVEVEVEVVQDESVL